MDSQPRKILTIDELIRPRSAPPTVEKTYSAPRRFDLTSMFVMMVVFAILLAGMNTLDFYPIVMTVITVFIATIGCAQALFHNSPPRKISIVTGIVLGLLIWMGVVISDFAGGVYESPLIGTMLSIPVAGIGAFFGYLAGAMVGGVFLVADVLRHRYGRAEDVSNQFVQEDG
jgi:hypothetical protein